MSDTDRHATDRAGRSDTLPLAVSFHTVDPDQRLDSIGLLAGSPVTAVELWEPTFAKDEGFVTQAREAFAAAAVAPRTVHAAFGGQYDLSSPDRTIREAGLAQVQVATDLAARMGADYVVVHPSCEPIGDDERAARLRNSRDSLRQIAAAAGDVGRAIAVELLPRTCLGRSGDELLDLVGDLDPAVAGICLDTNHLMADYASLPAVVRQIGSRLVALHCSDYDGVDEKHWPPLQGVIDWAAFHAALLAVGFAGPLNHEARLEGETPAERLAFLEGNWAKLQAALTA